MKKIVVCILAVLVLVAVSAHAEIIVQDDFEYEVDRDTADKSAFTTTGPWTAYKSRPSAAGAYGFTYTTTSISGFAGSFPGTSSSRVLVSEHLPGTYSTGQSDTYLSFYETGGSPVIPSTFYVQLWIYFQYYGDQLSRYENVKFIYPCGDDVATGTCPVQHHDWLMQMREDYSGEPYELRDGSAGQTHIYVKTEGTAAMEGVGETTGNLGPNQSTGTAKFDPNTWYLIRIYYDFSTNNPTYRMWRRTAAEESLTLVAEYVDGVTSGLTWTPYTNSGYYRINLLEMNDNVDCWFYVDDFILATTVEDLPSYSSVSRFGTGAGSMSIGGGSGAATFR